MQSFSGGVRVPESRLIIATINRSWHVGCAKSYGAWERYIPTPLVVLSTLPNLLLLLNQRWRIHSPKIYACIGGC